MRSKKKVETDVKEKVEEQKELKLVQEPVKEDKVNNVIMAVKDVVMKNEEEIKVKDSE